MVDALDNLVALHIRTEAGIMSVIKQLDSKLSDAIMKAMLMGQDLQTKVSGGGKDKGRGKGLSEKIEKKEGSLGREGKE